AGAVGRPVGEARGRHGAPRPLRRRRPRHRRARVLGPGPRAETCGAPEVAGPGARMIPKFPRAEIEKRTVRVLRPKTWVAPEVRLLDLDGTPAVLKDFAPLPLATRLAVGLQLVRWETKILRQLLGLQGVPQLLATVDRFAFVMSFLEARML